VGLRALGTPEAQRLREQIDALLEEEAGQAASGPANARLGQELGRAVSDLRKLLLRDREERFSLPLRAYEDSEDFLAKLEDAGKVLRGGLEPASREIRSGAAPAPAMPRAQY
jgi:hypothetical protein